MRIYGNNILSDCLLTASSTKSGYAVGNLKVNQLGKDFSFDGNTGSIKMVFGSEENIKHCLVDIGKMSDEVVVTLEANSSDSWDSPLYSKELIYTESALYLDLDETYQYFRLVFSDENVTDIQFGVISIGGSYLQMPAVSPKCEIFYSTTSENSVSIGGQISGDEGYDYMETAFTFPMISEYPETFDGELVATRKEIKELWENVKNITPVWVFLWANNLDEFPPVFCIIDQKKLSFKKTTYEKIYSTTLNLKEAL